MPRPKAHAPGYRYHVSGQAVVTFCGKNFYLGEYDSPQSRAKYFALLAEYHKNGCTSPPLKETHQADQPITVRCVTAEFREHIKQKYANNPQETNRFQNLCTTLEDEYGELPAQEFGPRRLAEMRDLFVASGNCRNYANRQTRNVVQIFRFAVSRELIGPDRIVALESLEPLRHGQTTAPESEPVESVDIELVKLTAPHLSPTLKAMLMVQVATGMRSGELVIMRRAILNDAGTGSGSTSRRSTRRVISANQKASRSWATPKSRSSDFSKGPMRHTVFRRENPFNGIVTSVQQVAGRPMVQVATSRGRIVKLIRKRRPVNVSIPVRIASHCNVPQRRPRLRSVDTNLDDN